MSTGSASGVLTTSVTLTGSVNPNSYVYHLLVRVRDDEQLRLEDGSRRRRLGFDGEPGQRPRFRVEGQHDVPLPAGGQERLRHDRRRRSDRHHPDKSCTGYAQTVAEDEQTVANQEAAVKTAELNLAQVEASIAASDTPSSATIAQDEAVSQAGPGDGRRRRGGGRRHGAHRPDHGNGDRRQRRGRLDGERGRIHTVSVAGQSSSSASSSASSSPTARKLPHRRCLRVRHGRLAPPAGGRGRVRGGGRRQI